MKFSAGINPFKNKNKKGEFINEKDVAITKIPLYDFEGDGGTAFVSLEALFEKPPGIAVLGKVGTRKPKPFKGGKGGI